MMNKVKNSKEDPTTQESTKSKKASKHADAKEVAPRLTDDKKSKNVAETETPKKSKKVEVAETETPKKSKKVEVAETETPKKSKRVADTENVETPKKSKKTVDAVKVETLKKTKKSAETVALSQTRTLLVDKNGLSLAPSRIKRLVLDVVFNRRFRVAIKELNDHKDTLLEASNLKEGYLSYHGFTQETLDYFRELQNNYFTKEQTKFERKKVKELLNSCPVDDDKKRTVPATLQNLVDLCKQTLLNDHTASLKNIYEKFDKNFYKEFTVVKDTYNLTGLDAFKFYKSLITRNKIRMNYNGNLRLTCFLELLLRHLVTQASTSCVNKGKSTVQFNNMHNPTVTDNYLFPVVSNQAAWTSAVAWQAGGRLAPVTEDQQVLSPSKVVPDFINTTLLNPDNKFKCNSYVVDICRYVDRTLAGETVKVSSEFRNLCNQVLLELVHNAANILRIIMNTSRDHTVSANMVDALVNIYHVAFNQTHLVDSTLTELDSLSLAYNKKQADAKAAKPKRNNTLTTVTP